MNSEEMKKLRDLQFEMNIRKIKQIEAYEELLRLKDIAVPIPMPEEVEEWGHKFESLKQTDYDKLRMHAYLDGVKERREEVEMSILYRDAFLGWKDYYKSESQRFGTSPVRGSYWDYLKQPSQYVIKTHINRKKICVKTPQLNKDIAKYYDKKLGITSTGPTMVFRRYENLIPELERDYYSLDILVKALLGFEVSIGYKFSQGHKVANDAWVVNMRVTEKENILMDAFLGYLEAA